MSVKKAVIPCAGLGTRFLPVTKVVPKEMLPIADTPALHYIVKEAVESGIEEILIIISPEKKCIEKYFKPNKALNERLTRDKKHSEYELANPDFGAKLRFAVQTEAKGSGAAVYLAREFAAGEPFAVLFGDDMIYAGDSAPATAQLIEVFQATGKNVVGCQTASEEVARRCGVIEEGEKDGRFVNVRSIIEKPQGRLPGRLVSLGRFVVCNEIFEALENTELAQNGELYLTDALSRLAANGRVAACEFEGRRYDMGNKEGYLEATVECALRDPKLGAEFAQYLKRIII